MTVCGPCRSIVPGTTFGSGTFLDEGEQCDRCCKKLMCGELIGRDMDEDIVQSVVDDSDREKTAMGQVDGTTIELTKSKHVTRGQQTKWHVIAENTETGDVEKNRFDDAIHADEHFEGLQDKYGLEMV